MKKLAFPGISRGELFVWLSVFLAVSLLVRLATGSFTPLGAQESKSKREQGAPGATREPLTVTAADISHTVLVTGELRASRSREVLVPRIQSGFASAVTFLAPEGSWVKQGRRIVEFDASSLLSQKSEAERKLDEAKLKIRKTGADLEAERADLLGELAQAEGNLRLAQLYGKIGKELLAANQYKRYQLDLDKANLATEKARERLRNHESGVAAELALVELERAQAELELKKIEGDLSLLSVDAPQDGLVIYGDNWANNRKIQVGDTLFPGMQVLTLPDLSSLEAHAFVYDTDLRFVSAGMTCELSLDAVPRKSWRGKVVSLTSVASRKSFASRHKVFKAVIRPDAVDAALMKPGMTVRVGLAVSLASTAAAIPREYLGLDNRGRYYVLKGGDPKKARVQIVTVGSFNDRLVEIKAGLKSGERILRPRSGERKS